MTWKRSGENMGLLLEEESESERARATDLGVPATRLCADGTMSLEENSRGSLPRRKLTGNCKTDDACPYHLGSRQSASPLLFLVLF